MRLREVRRVRDAIALQRDRDATGASYAKCMRNIPRLSDVSWSRIQSFPISFCVCVEAWVFLLWWHPSRLCVIEKHRSLLLVVCQKRPHWTRLEKKICIELSAVRGVRWSDHWGKCSFVFFSICNFSNC